MFTDYLIKIIWGEMLVFALALIKCCWVVKSIAGLPNIIEKLFYEVLNFERCVKTLLK